MQNVTKQEFKQLFFTYGVRPHSGYDFAYWEQFFNDDATRGMTFQAEEPESHLHTEMMIVTDKQAMEYRLFFMTEESTESFFDTPGAE